MATRTVMGFELLGRPSGAIPTGDFSAAESELGRRLPSSYREVLARFGRGTFVEERWLLPPSALQSYGSLFEEGCVAEPLPSSMTVFAASDAGDSWAWLPQASGDDGSEPSVWLVPRGCVGVEDETARPRVVASDVEGLLSSWRREVERRGVVTPYFVAAAPRMLASDLALLSPGTFDAAARAHLALGEALEDAVVLVRFSGDGVHQSRWFLRRACAIVALQTSPETSLASDAATDSRLRIQWLDEGRIEGVAPLLEALVGRGWLFAQARAPTLVWSSPVEGARERALAVLAKHGIR